jgi:hypothetical protein
MAILSRIFNSDLTDLTFEDPVINTSYFPLGTGVGQYADESLERGVYIALLK